MLRSPEAIYLRQWWWSKQPFWQYLGADLRGWANLVDKHPGLFNLAWSMAGVDAPPAKYEDFSAQTGWVFSEAVHIPVAGQTLADWAFKLELGEFRDLVSKRKRELCRWKFYDKHMSYEALRQALDKSCALRA